MNNDDDYDDRSEEEMYPPPRKKTRSSDQTRKSRTVSYVWKYFTRDAEKDSKTATCNICNGEVKRNTSSTSMLIAHLHRAHNIEREFECKLEQTDQKILKTYDMNIPSPPTPPEEEGSVIRSFDVGVQELMANPEKLKGSYISDYESDRSIVNNEIISDLARNEQFSATIIETNACPQRRFLNVSISSARKSYFLGMIPVTELDGNQVARLVEKKLTEFGLDFWQDLIGITTHSSTMMSVDGDNDGPLHQLCLAHVIQLCVKDVLYVEHLEVKAESPAMMVEVVFDFDLDEEDDFDALKRKYWRLVSKVCRAVKLFENEHFHEYPRRWSNLLKLLKRFINYSKEHTFAADEDFTPEELASVNELFTALGPLQQLYGYLMKPKVDLVGADNLFGFTLALLDRQETPVSGLIRDRLQTRYLERRNCDVVHVMNFLEDPKYLEKGSDHFGVAIEKQTIVDSTALLIERLRVRGKTKLGHSVSKNVEMYCKKSSKRPKLLDNLYTSLRTIHPTSVESLNRSSMKWLGPGARAAISDELLNALVFMRRQMYLDSSN